MHKKMAYAARAAIADVIRRRYQSASSKEKRKILDEFVATTGYHEKSAIRVLNGQTPARHRQTRKRPSIYDEAARGALIVSALRFATRSGGGREEASGNIADEAIGNKCMVCPESARSFLIESRHRHASMYPACWWSSRAPGLDGSRAHRTSLINRPCQAVLLPR
jgi:hypothetical protein